MNKNRLVRLADEKSQISDLMQLVIDDSNTLLKVEQQLVQHLNNIYIQYGNVYDELNKTVKLPTNEEIKQTIAFNQDLKRVFQYLSDENYLQSVLEGNPLKQ